MSVPDGTHHVHVFPLFRFDAKEVGIGFCGRVPL